jgi:hypothetical protein
MSDTRQAVELTLGMASDSRASKQLVHSLEFRARAHAPAREHLEYFVESFNEKAVAE